MKTNIFRNLSSLFTMIFMFSFLSCSEENITSLEDNFLKNTVIQSVCEFDGEEWKSVSQVKVGTHVRLEGVNLETATSVSFNDKEVASTDFIKLGNTYLEVVIPQTTPLNRLEESVANTIKVKTDINEFVFDKVTIISSKLSINGVRVFSSSEDYVGKLVASAEIGTQIQVEGAGLNVVNKLFFNGYAVDIADENRVSSTALKVNIPMETPVGENVTDQSKLNKIDVETSTGEKLSSSYSFTFTGPTAKVDEDGITNEDGSTISVINPGDVIKIKGVNMDLVNEVWCNGTKLENTAFSYDGVELIITIPSDLPVGEDNVELEDMNKIIIKTPYGSTTIEISIAGNEPSPLVTSVSHTMAKAGEYIYIWGENFNDVSSVIFPGSVSATDFDKVDNKTIKVKVPKGGDVTPGYITLETTTGKQGYSYNDINRKDNLFITTFSGDGYAGSSKAKFNGKDITMSGTQTVPYPANTQGFPASPANYRLIPSDGAIDVLTSLISTDGNDLLKFRFTYDKLWGVANVTSSGIADETLCENLAIEFDFYMTCPWTLGSWRWETGKNSTDGNGRMTIALWNQQTVVPFEFYGGWRTMILPLSQLSCFGGLTIAQAKTEFPNTTDTYISLKAGNFKNSDGNYSKGTDMKGYQLAFGAFRLVPYVKGPVE